MIDLIGHVAYGAVFGGMWLVSRKQISGWVIKGVGDVVWVAIGWQLGMTSIVVWASAFAAMDAWGYYKWRRDADKDSEC